MSVLLGWGPGQPMLRTVVTTVHSGRDIRPLRALRVLSTLRLVLALALTVHMLGLRSSAQQQDQSGSMPDAPSSSKARAAPQGNNAMQSSAQFVSLLQRESIVFPNLATSTAPLSPEQKLKLAVNNSVSLSAFVAGQPERWCKRGARRTSRLRRGRWGLRQAAGSGDGPKGLLAVSWDLPAGFCIA